jgi:hypothetical protein
MDKLHTIVSKSSIRTNVAGGYSRQGLASEESQVRCRVTLTAGCAVEFGKRILDERKASCPPPFSFIAGGLCTQA